MGSRCIGAALVLGIFLSLFIFLFELPFREIQAAFVTGGTNYAVYDLGAYGTNPIEANWGYLQFVIPHYDRNPQLVQQQITAMCDAGQKKITLILWFHNEGYDNWRVNASTGKMSPLMEDNLKQVLLLIKNQKNHSMEPCFNELHFRFANAGAAVNPNNWTVWNETQYLQNKSFIWYTRNIVKNELADASIQLLFDLGLELGGVSNAQTKAYTTRLWSDYTKSFGKSDTYGFSSIGNKFLSLIAVYDSVGVRPDWYAVDVYDSIDTILKTMLSDMKTKNEQAKPVIIQETYFNHSTAFSQIKSAQSAGMNIYTIMQWQLEQGKGPHFSTVSPIYSYFGTEYNPVPWPHNFSSTCASDSQTVTLQWNPVSNVLNYLAYLDDTTNNSPTCVDSWYCPGTTDYLNNQYKQTSISLPIIPNNTYKAWVHTQTSAGNSDPSVTEFICKGTKPGDLNVDGKVDFVDLQVFLPYFSQTNTQYNLFGSSVVDIFDLNKLFGYMFK